MANSDRMSGVALVVQFIHSGGTADLSGDRRTLTVTRDSQMADATAGNDTGDYNVYLRQINSATLNALFTGTAGSASWGSVTARGVEGTLLYAPSGTAAGNPKGGFPAVVKSANVEFPYDGMATLNIEFVAQGAELFDPASDVWS